MTIREYRRGPTTARLFHRAFEPGDAQAFFELNTHPEVMRYTGEALFTSVEAAKLAIEAYPDWATYGYGRWATVLESEQRVIGFCGLKYLEELGEVDVGYRFLPEYWGRGIATEAASASIVFGFEVLGLERIIGLVLPENEASIHVLEKIGMEWEKSTTCDGLSAHQFAMDRSAFDRLERV